MSTNVITAGLQIISTISSSSDVELNQCLVFVCLNYAHTPEYIRGNKELTSMRRTVSNITKVSAKAQAMLAFSWSPNTPGPAVMGMASMFSI